MLKIQKHLDLRADMLLETSPRSSSFGFDGGNRGRGHVKVNLQITISQYGSLTLQRPNRNISMAASQVRTKLGTLFNTRIISPDTGTLIIKITGVIFVMVNSYTGNWHLQLLKQPPWAHTMDLLWEKFQWILPLFFKPISFQSKASVVCSINAAILIDFCQKKLNVFS